MGLTRLAIHRPIVVLMALAALMCLGWRARQGLPAELDPKVEIPIVNVTAVYPGASPEEVEQRLTRPIEDTVASVANVTSVGSRCFENGTTVSVELKLGTDINAAAADIRARVDSIRASLPDEIEAPQVAKFDFNARPIMVLGVTGSGSLEQIRQTVDEQIRPRLSQVPGLGNVEVVGGRTREIQVRVDADRLNAAGLSIIEVLRPLGAASRSAAAGNFVQGRKDVSVRVLGEFRSVEDLRNTAVTAQPPGNGIEPVAPLRVGDLAEVRDTVADRDQITRVGRKESVGLILTRIPDANSVQVADGVKKVLHTLTDKLPSATTITVLQDHSVTIADALEDIYFTLVLGSLLAVLVVWAFLHSLKDTLIVACAIPTSIIVTFIVMYFAGFSLNQMTMLALSLSVGILVDDSILVLECIHRHRAMNKEPDVAALDGRAEIGLADAANTFVDVVVFIPIAFMGGVVGQFFRQFGLTIATATLASLYISFSLTPMLASRWLRKGEGFQRRRGFAERFDRSYDRIEARYRGALAWALRHRGTVVLAGFGSLLAAGALAWQFLGFDFTPSNDRGQVKVEMELPAGSSLDATNTLMAAVEDVAASVPEVDAQRMLATVGQILGGFGSIPDRGPELGQLTLMLIEKQGFLDRIVHPFGERGKRRRTDEQVAADLRERLKALPGSERITVSAVRGLTSARAPIETKLTGSDAAELEAVADSARVKLTEVGLLRNVDSSFRRGRPELQVVLDRDRAEERFVTPEELAGVVRTAIAGNTDFLLREGSRSFPIRVQVASPAAGSDSGRGLDADLLRDLIVGRRVVGMGSAAARVTVGDVAEIRFGSGPTKILREERIRQVILSAQVREGVSLGDARRAAEAALEQVSYGGVTRRWGGDVSDMEQSAGLMTGALLLAIALSYMLMAALFNSLLHPLTIMASVPMALVGGLLGLIGGGETMNIVSMIGIVMLVGLVSKNAILLVDYTNTLRAEGLERDVALQRAGPVRLRPILMTTASTVMAMTPVALKIGRASEMRSPMAIVVIGGLLLSTLLTLLVIPVMYTYFDDLSGHISRLFARGDRRAIDSAEAPAAPATAGSPHP
jgi:HAE1 family hydrophobic/amphiphilic exporter-1